MVKIFVSLLVAVSVLFPAVRTRPGDPVAGNPPLVFIHAGLAHGKPTPTLPAKHKFPLAAMADFNIFLPAFFPTGAAFFSHHINILLLFLKR
jgi:hypothetical protein